MELLLGLHIFLVSVLALLLHIGYIQTAGDHVGKRMLRVGSCNWQEILSIDENSTLLHDAVRALHA